MAFWGSVFFIITFPFILTGSVLFIRVLVVILKGEIACVSLVWSSGAPPALFLKLPKFGPWHWSGREFPYQIHTPPGLNLSALSFKINYCLHFMQAGFA